MKKEEFINNYSRWSSVVLISIVALVGMILLTDMVYDFEFSKNIYLLTFFGAGSILAILSVVWISVLNARGSKSDPPPVLVQEVKEREMTLNDIEYCIRKEGYIPVRHDGFVSFKAAGEDIEIFYESEKLSLVKTYGLSKDINLKLLSDACSMLHDTTFLVRSSLHKYDNGEFGLIFEVQTFIISPRELERYFERYLGLLYSGIQRHRDIYDKLLEESQSPPEEQQLPSTREHKVVS